MKACQTDCSLTEVNDVENPDTGASINHPDTDTRLRQVGAGPANENVGVPLSIAVFAQSYCSKILSQIIKERAAVAQSWYQLSQSSGQCWKSL